MASNSAGQFVVALQETEASSLPAVRRRIAARLLPFQQSGELRTALIFCIDDEVNSGSVRARPREFPEAADLSEPSMLARP